MWEFVLSAVYKISFVCSAKISFVCSAHNFYLQTVFFSFAVKKFILYVVRDFSFLLSVKYFVSNKILYLKRIL